MEMNRVKRFLELLNAAFEEKALIPLYRTRKRAFTREEDAKLPFAHLVLFLLWNSKLAARSAIKQYIREKKLDFTLKKQSLFESREKLSHRIFIDLNEIWFLHNTVYSGKFETWNGCRIIAVDGSVFDVPPDAEYFGRLKTAGGSVPKARVLGCVDVLNDFVVKADIKPFSISEGAMAKEILRDFSKVPGTEDVFLFDRGFFSRDLARQLVKSKQKFLFRISRKSLKELNSADENDQIIVRKDKNQEDLVLRVINFPLPSGEMEKLATNIFDENLTPSDFFKLYNFRWGIEVSYLMLKNRIEIEDFSSAKTELILQDFFAAVLLYNLTIAEIQDAASEDPKPVIRKLYAHKVNKNNAFSELRNLLIDAVLSENPAKLSDFYARTRREILGDTVPIRPNRPSPPRSVKYKKAKYSHNKKRSY
jgi:hypothetical protein